MGRLLAPAPPAGRLVVRGLGLDPGCGAVSQLFAFPERGAGLQVIHQEFGCRERGLPVRRCGHHQHDVFARQKPAVAMHDDAIVQRPARDAFGKERSRGVSSSIGR